MGARTLSQWDQEDIQEALLGRRIVAVELRDFRESAEGWERPDGARWGDQIQGRLTLDDGTVLWVAPNEGCGGCTSGRYGLTSLGAVDNVITAVRVAQTEHPDDPEDDGKHSYRIYVVADAEAINVLQVDGDDGNGYYGTGYELIVVAP